MATQLLEPQPERSRRKFWRRWKWIGLAVYAAVLILNRWLPGPIVAAGYIYGIIVIANLLFYGFRYLKDRLFWRVRNRLLGAFLFVGVIPLVLLIGIIAISGYVLLGQLAGRYLELSLEEIEHQVTAINKDMASHLTEAATEAELRERCRQALAAHTGQFSRLSARMLRRDSAGAVELIAASEPSEPGKPSEDAAWLGSAESFQGLVRKGKQVDIVSLQPMPGRTDLSLLVATPLDGTIEGRLQKEKSIYCAVLGVGSTNVTVRNNSVSISVSEKGPEAEKAMTEAAKLDTRRNNDPRRKVAWALVLDGKEQHTGNNEHIAFAVLYVPIATVYAHSMGQGPIQNNMAVSLIYVLGGMFLFVELVSLVIGFTISRRITRSVHDMHQGILALQRGELEHQIPVRRQDQLGLLAHSFNHMSASITRLLEEVSEKKRLEQELEIAREVQATLFPKQLPHPRGMVVYGGCEPARVVSGDYYDFIVEDPARLDIVVADISGKGISAALLMANLQAAMRSQLLAAKLRTAEEISRSLSSVVANLNQQIYANSPAEKYATLFLGRYDAEARLLWYCNAGHLSPVLIDGEHTRLLEATGMVVGLLPDATYEVGCVDLRPGALLAIFTDGVTETVNSEDEEFGEQRLISALKEARAFSPEGVYRSVISRMRAWQGNLPQRDDITLIIAKAN